MIDERHGGVDGTDGGDTGGRTALDHDYLNAERARRCDLAIGGAAAGILGDDDIDALVLEQSPLIFFAERAAGEKVTAVGNGEWRLDGIDAAHEIAMLGCSREASGFLATDREEDLARLAAQRSDGGLDILHARPAVAIGRLPGWTAKCEDWDTRAVCGHGGVGGDFAREGMSGVYHEIDLFLSQIINEPLDTSEAANPRRQGQRLGIGGPPRKGDDCRNVVARREFFGQAASLGRASQYQDTVLSHG